MKKTIGLYIHIPFCKSKCYYCDFLSKPNQEDYFQAYVQALDKEMLAYHKLLSDYVVTSIFIGGGTPTILPIELLQKIGIRLGELFFIDPKAEFTIESNPGTLSFEALSGLKKTGVNRLSIGLQAFQNRLLKKLGRVHTLEQFLQNYENALKVGFDNINIDLMFGLPEQETRDWEESLLKVIQLDPPHLSCYSLILEEGTPFFRMWDQGHLLLPTEDDTLQMYRKCIQMLTDAGYEHYEISNFAKPQRKCKHNLRYWNCDEYVGLGVGAHSYFQGIRYHNQENLAQYIKESYCLQKLQKDPQTIHAKEAYEEYMFLGLRLIQGVSKEEFYHRFQRSMEEVYGSVLQKLVKLGLLKEEENNVKLTKRGLEVGNVVFEQFLLE